jgi:peptidoglycan hydrolase-like protein with peptidoglycan-binding domain
MDLREVQTRLRALGLYSGPVRAPANTKAHDDAVMAFFRLQRVTGWDKWPAARRTIAAGQALCRMDGIPVGDIDGLVGPMTTHAFDVYDARKANGGKPVPEVETWRDEKPATSPSKPPAAAAQWPTQRDVSKFFGAVGSNQVTLELPYQMRLAWDTKTSVNRISCHKKVKPAFARVFQRALDHYGFEEIKKLRLDLFGGCLNVRKMRGGSAWSMHAWGIAFDIDPANNALKTKAPAATLSRPIYETFWGFVEDEGLVSLGRSRNYDWMHFQAARL